MAWQGCYRRAGVTRAAPSAAAAVRRVAVPGARSRISLEHHTARPSVHRPPRGRGRPAVGSGRRPSRPDCIRRNHRRRWIGQECFHAESWPLAQSTDGDPAVRAGLGSILASDEESGPTQPTVVAFDVTPGRVLASVTIRRREAAGLRDAPPPGPGRCALRSLAQRARDRTAAQVVATRSDAATVGNRHLT